MFDSAADFLSFNEINEFEVIDEKFPLFDQVSLNSRHCYEFTIPQNTSNDSLILTLAVFSGKITLDLNDIVLISMLVINNRLRRFTTPKLSVVNHVFVLVLSWR